MEATKTNLKLWLRAKAQAKAKMGGKHSARAMQYAVQLYKKWGGGFRGKKSSSNNLTKWANQKWQYSSKKMEGKGRYLPDKAWESLKPGEKAATNRAKIKGTRSGRQFVRQPSKIANKVRKYRD
ncbi:hypothetical protein BZZ01_04800 [Nostocales cyanobacterium HT-58-2]|nr:hypothetical protein BZZ01_04800 [Nostocales cyanobacterium HT-58-2]